MLTDFFITTCSNMSFMLGFLTDINGSIEGTYSFCLEFNRHVKKLINMSIYNDMLSE